MRLAVVALLPRNASTCLLARQATRLPSVSHSLRFYLGNGSDPEQITESPARYSAVTLMGSYSKLLAYMYPLHPAELRHIGITRRTNRYGS